MKLAVARGGLLRADLGLFAHQELDQHLALTLDLVARRLDAHAGLAGANARGGEDAGADVDNADAAHADGPKARLMTERRDLDADGARRVPYRRAFGDADSATVDRE